MNLLFALDPAEGNGNPPPVVPPPPQDNTPPAAKIVNEGEVTEETLRLKRELEKERLEHATTKEEKKKREQRIMELEDKNFRDKQIRELETPAKQPAKTRWTLFDSD